MKKFRCLNLSATWLVLLLQRTPVLRLASAAGEFAAPSRVVSLLKSFAATAVSLGAVHSLAGATQFAISNANVSGTVGTAITPVAFTVTGAQTPAGSYKITGTLPPGLAVTNVTSAGVLNASSGSITGTPTTAGSYSISILAYEHTNASGDSFGPATIRFTIAGATNSAPTISTQPASQSVNAGTTVTLSVSATGTPTPAYQWRMNGANLSGATSATLTLNNVQASDGGDYSVVVSNSAGSVTSNVATLTVLTTVTGPVIATQPQSQHLALGGATTLTVAASGSGLSYQWKKNGEAISGATGANFTLSSASADTMGFYSVSVSNSSGSTDSAVATITVNTGGASRLVNVSTRGYVPAGNALTSGFVLQGTGTKTLVIRGVGPTLASFGVSGTLADPVMEVIASGSSSALVSNDNWGGDSSLRQAFVSVGAFPLSDGSSTDASAETVLRASGASGYTVRITSKATAAAGIVLAEVYDEEAITAPVRLVNVSTSGFVGTGDQALVPGFVVSGSGPKLVLVRAVGPGLTTFGVTGVLNDPQISIVPLGKSFPIASNDNWGGGATLQSAFTQAGAFSLAANSNDAAVLMRLPPGGYTVVVSGVGNTSGNALVEVYDLD